MPFYPRWSIRGRVFCALPLPWVGSRLSRPRGLPRLGMGKVPPSFFFISSNICFFFLLYVAILFSSYYLLHSRVYFCHSHSVLCMQSTKYGVPDKSVISNFLILMRHSTCLNPPPFSLLVFECYCYLPFT